MEQLEKTNHQNSTRIVLECSTDHLVQENGATLTTLVILIVLVIEQLEIADWRGRPCKIVSFYQAVLGRP